MPCSGISDDTRARQERAKAIRARLLARGLDPRGNGFLRAFFKAMRK